MPKVNFPLPQTALLWLGYLLCAIILTWPTAAQLTTHLPGDGGDDPAIAWNLWWIKYALFNSGQNPFEADVMFYPLGINLAFYTLTLLNGLTSLPFVLNLGVVAATNLHTAFTFVVGAYGTFLLVRYLLRPDRFWKPVRSTTLDWWIAALCGLFYGFASCKLFYVALGQFNIASTHWIPFAILFTMRASHSHAGTWEREDRRRDWSIPPTSSIKNSHLAALFLLFQAYTEMTYASFLLVWIGLWWAWVLLFQRKGLSPIPFVVLPLTFTVGLIPLLSQMLPDMWAEGDFLVEGSGFAEAFSADLLGFIVPTMHHPLLGELIRQTSIIHFDKGQQIYIGWVLLGLALIAILARPDRSLYRVGISKLVRSDSHHWFWLTTSLIFLLLCLGPIIQLNGWNTELSGPFVLFQYLPFFRGNRYPSRYAVMLILSLSVVASFALHWLTSRLKPMTAHVVLGLIAVAFLFEHLSAPLPQSDMRVPSAYQTIADDPRPVVVLDIPFAWRNGFRITGALTTQFMFGQFYQTAHQKPMLQGNTSRNPAFKFQYFTDAPILNSLLTLQTGQILPDSQWQADAPYIAEFLRFYQIGYIVVRPDLNGNPIVTPQATIPYIEQLLPVTKLIDRSEMIVYRVDLPEPPTRYTVQPDQPTAPFYFGEGWGLISPDQPFVAQRQHSRLMLPLRGGQPHRLTLQLNGQTELSLSLNGEQIAESPNRRIAESSTISFDLPAYAVRKGLNDLWLNVSQVRSPTEPSLAVVSAGEWVGGFGQIFVNGVDYSPNERGFNVVILDENHHLLDMAHFDTHADPQASPALAAYLDRYVEQPVTITLTVADEASLSLDETALTALRSLGLQADLTDCFRCSYAAIRLANGESQEQMSHYQTVKLTYGLGHTEPTIGVQITSIELEVVE